MTRTSTIQLYDIFTLFSSSLFVTSAKEQGCQIGPHGANWATFGSHWCPKISLWPLFGALIAKATYLCKLFDHFGNGLIRTTDPESLVVDTIVILLSHVCRELWPKNGISVMAALICTLLKMPKGANHWRPLFEWKLADFGLLFASVWRHEFRTFWQLCQGGRFFAFTCFSVAGSVKE